MLLKLFFYFFEDLVFSDFDENKHWLVKDDLKLLTKFDTKGERGLYLKARNSVDGLVIYILYENEIKISTVSKDGGVSESGNLTINSKSGLDHQCKPMYCSLIRMG